MQWNISREWNLVIVDPNEYLGKMSSSEGTYFLLSLGKTSKNWYFMVRLAISVYTQPPYGQRFVNFFCVFFIFLTQTFSELESPLFRYVTWYYLSHPSPIIALPCPWRVKMLSSRNLSLNSCLDNGRWQRVWWQNSGIWIYIIHLRHHHAAISNPMLNRKRREVSSCILGNNSVTVLFEAFFFTVTLRALSAFSAWTGLSRIACKLLPMPPTSRIF